MTLNEIVMLNAYECKDEELVDKVKQQTTVIKNNTDLFVLSLL